MHYLLADVNRSKMQHFVYLVKIIHANAVF